jgi:hypothetical protein
MCFFFHGQIVATPCDNFMAETRKEYKEPDEITETEEYENHAVTWLYATKDMQLVFEWGPRFEGCQRTTKSVDALSVKGIKIKAKHLKAQHPKWSSVICMAVAKEQIQVGMTREQVIASWGDPEHKSKTVSQYGVLEIWHYGNSTLLFDQDKLKSYRTEQ